MFNRRFIPYFIAICIFVCLSVSYIGIRAYQNHVKLNAFVADAKMFQWSLDKDVPPQPYEYAGNFKMDELMPQEVTGPDGETYRTIVPPGMDIETLQTGGYIMNFTPDQMVTQLVETPDGEIHEIIVPRGFELQEGAAVSPSEIDRPIADTRRVVRINGIEYEIPEGVDPVEYEHKLLYVSEGLSMEEVERKIEAGEIRIHISDEERRISEEAERRRAEWLKRLPTEKPPMSDKPPVKVRFMTDEEMGEVVSDSIPPKWVQELLDTDQHSHSGAADHSPHSAEHSAAGTATEEVNRFEDIEDSPARSEVSSVMDEPSGSISKVPTTKNAETDFKALSPAHLDKAQKLIVQYGTDEGLRRLREVDPEVAQQFERERLRSERLRSAEPSRDAPDGEGSER